MRPAAAVEDTWRGSLSPVAGRPDGQGACDRGRSGAVSGGRPEVEGQPGRRGGVLRRRRVPRGRLPDLGWRLYQEPSVVSMDWGDEDYGRTRKDDDLKVKIIDNAICSA